MFNHLGDINDSEQLINGTCVVFVIFFIIIFSLTDDLQGYPRITENPSLKNVEKEQTAILVCSARAENLDQPTIYWLKDNLPLDTGDPRVRVDDDGIIRFLMFLYLHISFPS